MVLPNFVLAGDKGVEVKAWPGGGNKAGTIGGKGTVASQDNGVRNDCSSFCKEQ